MAPNNTFVKLAVSLLVCAASACASTTPAPQLGQSSGAGGSPAVIAEPQPGGSPLLEPGPEPAACVDDGDCGPDLVCREVLIAACAVCDGGRMVRTCTAPIAVASPVAAPSVAAPGDECPRHVDCMPPLPDGEVCPPPGLMERCPGTSVTW